MVCLQSVVDGWGSEIGSTLTFSTLAEVLPSVSVLNMCAVCPFTTNLKWNTLNRIDYVLPTTAVCTSSDIQEKGLTLVIVTRLHANLQNQIVSAYIYFAYSKFFIAFFCLNKEFYRTKYIKTPFYLCT